MNNCTNNYIYSFPPKDPDEVLDYLFDWSLELETTETIVSHSITVSNITNVSDVRDNTNKKVSVRLSGGIIGDTGKIECTVTTSVGQIIQRTAEVKIVRR